jgi:hypothetical protein
VLAVRGPDGPVLPLDELGVGVAGLDPQHGEDGAVEPLGRGQVTDGDADVVEHHAEATVARTGLAAERLGIVIRLEMHDETLPEPIFGGVPGELKLSGRRPTLLALGDPYSPRSRPELATCARRWRAKARAELYVVAAAVDELGPEAGFGPQAIYWLRGPWAALEAVPPRLDTPLVFPATRSGLLSLHNFRRRVWLPAVRASGVARPTRIYHLRSTFASNALAAGVTVFELARVMGTSVAMIERHYGALLDGAHAGIAGRLDAFVAELERACEVATREN